MIIHGAAFYEVLAYDDTTTDAVAFVIFTQNFETLLVAYPCEKRSYSVRFKYLFQALFKSWQRGATWLPFLPGENPSIDT